MTTITTPISEPAVQPLTADELDGAAVSGGAGSLMLLIGGLRHIADIYKDFSEGNYVRGGISVVTGQAGRVIYNIATGQEAFPATTY